MQKGVSALAALLLSAACGCGTIANLEGRAISGHVPCPTEAFGGLTQDYEVMTASPNGFVLVPDLLLSLVGDTVTLPWAMYNEGWQASEGSKPGQRDALLAK